MLYFITVLFLILIDQITKYYIITKFSLGSSIPIIKDFLHITFVKNHGVAFGLLQGKLNIISIVTIFVVIGIIYHLKHNTSKLHILEKIGYVLIISGAIGNMIDRFYRGFVIDMIDFRGIWKFVFNFADVWINIGVALIIIDYLYISFKKKQIN